MQAAINVNPMSRAELCNSVAATAEAFIQIQMNIYFAGTQSHKHHANNS